MIFITRTHIGYFRLVNEDRLLVRTLPTEQVLLLAADGMGGHPGGDVAASLVSRYVEDQPAESVPGNLEQMLINSGYVIARHGAAHPPIDGMGSTGTLVPASQSRVEWAHVGDCRLYHLNGSGLQCKTRDQTLARQMFDLGEIKFDEIRGHRLNHMLEQCLGEDDIEPDTGEFRWNPGDILLLNTDGLNNMLTDEQIHSILIEPNSLTQKADNLLEQALRAGGNDNISFIIGLHDNN